MQVSTAIEATCELLAELPDRRAHALACGEAAVKVAAQVLEGDGARIVSAAYLHDVGYSQRLVRTGMHSLDGAAWLAGMGEPALASLVAHHSAAECEARQRGLTTALEAYPKPHQLEADILTYCDFSSGPRGELMTFEERFRDINRRYPEGHPVRLAVARARPQLWQSVRRVRVLLKDSLTSR